MGTDKPIQLIELRKGEENTIFHLNSETVKTITEKAGDRPLSVICIVGPTRQAKSFILGYMIRRLEAMEKGKHDWMDSEERDKPLSGFKFKNGSRTETQGIWIWSRPFIVKNDDDKEIAALLIDTQGTFDESTARKDESAIVGLSLLTSSVMIFNQFTSLQEDVLTSLNTYTSYGKMALESLNDGTPPFQKLVFLIRDWNNPAEYGFGSEGGNKFLEDKLKIEPERTQESNQARKAILDCFQDVDCYLMPYIGDKALDHDFTGSISELTPNFAKHMEEFINNLISGDKLVTKTILGNEVTTTDWATHLEKYIELFNLYDVPSAESIWKATAAVHNEHIVRKACKKFQKLVSKKMRGNYSLETEDMEKVLSGGWKTALEVFRKSRLLGTPEKIRECRNELERMLEIQRMEYLRQNEEKQNKYFPENKNLDTPTSSLRYIGEKIRSEEAEYRKRQESLYAEAVSTSLKFYEKAFKALLDSVGFLTEKNLKSEHERVKQKILQELDFQPTAAANYKNLEVQLEEKFKDIEKENNVKWKDAEAKAKFSIFKCKNKYLSAMRAEMEIVEKKVGDIARQTLEDNCSAWRNQNFSDAQTLELERWIQNIETKINGQIEELAREVARDERAGI